MTKKYIDSDSKIRNIPSDLSIPMLDVPNDRYSKASFKDIPKQFKLSDSSDVIQEIATFSDSTQNAPTHLTNFTVLMLNPKMKPQANLTNNSTIYLETLVVTYGLQSKLQGRSSFVLGPLDWSYNKSS